MSRSGGLAAAGLLGVAWAMPFAWMAVAGLRPGLPVDVASLTPSGPFGFEHYAEAWSAGDYRRWYINTVLVCFGILAVQLVTASLAGYAFARLRFRGQGVVFTLFLLQILLIPALLIVPNLTTIAALGLYDRLPAIMAPYLASGFGVLMMRQAFRAIPRDYEDAAMLDGARLWQLIWHVLLPMTRPALAAFAVVSVTAHWNEYLWPLIAVSSPGRQVLTVGLASFASGAEAGGNWGLLAAGTVLVAGPLVLAFLLFQRRIVASFVFSGLK